VSKVNITVNLGNSDHNMEVFSIQHEQVSFVNKRQIQDYNRGDCQSIREELQLTDWDISISDDTTVCRNNFKKSVGLRRKVYTFLKI